MKTRFNVTGMSCAACSAHVDRAVRNLTGVQDVNVNLLSNIMDVDFDPALVTSSQICEAVKKAGYAAEAASGKHRSSDDDTLGGFRRFHDRSFRKLIFSAVVLIMLVYTGMGSMIGLPIPRLMSPDTDPHIYCLVQLFLSFTICIINRSYYINGLKRLLDRAPGMDTLIAIGSGTSFFYSLFLTVKCIILVDSGDISEASAVTSGLYFESAAMILVFVSVGKTLEAGSKVRTTDSIRRLMSLKPLTAFRIRDGIETEIPLDAICVGDILAVRAGQTIPADGVVISGGCAVDEAALTGESVPSDKQPGSEVYQATILTSGYMTFEVRKSGDDTTLSRIIALVEEASSSRAPISRLADRISAVFVPIVLGIALVTLIIRLISGQDLSTAIGYAISVVVISCPCALGLATPTAIMAGTGRAAELGILFRSAEILELTHKIDTVALDKTGTVTSGVLSVTDIISFNGYTDDEVLRLAAAVEAFSEHPIGRAVVDHYNRSAGRSGAVPSVTDYHALAAGGVSGYAEGRLIQCGSPASLSVDPGDEISRIYISMADEGKTPVLIAADRKICGMISVRDTVKPDSRAAVDEFHRLGIRTVMLTGDNERTAMAVAREVGISEVMAGIRPDGKDAAVSRLKAEGHTVAMVGDGINDAPSLTRADVGIAIGSGTDIAIEAADIVLTGSRLSEAVTAVKLSHATMRNIKQNLFWAFFYNSIGIPIAAGVFSSSLGLTISPMIAAALMSCSSLFVVSNALRLRYFGRKHREGSPEVQLMTDISEEADNIDNNIQKGESTMKVKVTVNGMMCMHCSGHVEQAFNSVDGIECTVDLEAKTAYLTLSRDFTDEELMKIVSDAGYEPVEVIRD